MQQIYSSSCSPLTLWRASQCSTKSSVALNANASNIVRLFLRRKSDRALRPRYRRLAGRPVVDQPLWQFQKAVRATVRNLRRAAEFVVPLGQTPPCPEELATRTEKLLEAGGMRIHGRIGFYSRFGTPAEDDPRHRIMATPISCYHIVGPAFFCTFRGWTLFWHFPKLPLTFPTLAAFSEALMVKSLVGARIDGYFSHPGAQGARRMD